MHDLNLIARASGFHPWDAMAPAALSGILKRGPFRSSVETGCGGSTIVLSHASDRHIAFAIEGKDRTITDLRKQSDLRSENAIFVEGETRDTLPEYQFEGEVDLVLLDAREYEEVTFQAEPGDTIVLYSDGITDHLNAAGTEFGRGRLVQLVRAHGDKQPDELIGEIFKELDKFSTVAFDDQTVFVMKVK